MSVIKTAQAPESHWLNKTQMADSLGISVQAFDKWGVQPIAKVGRSVYFTVSDVVANRLEKELSKHQPSSIEFNEEGVGIEFERLRLTKAQADNMEIKNEIARGNIAPIEIITWVLSTVAGEAAGEIDAIPLNIRRKHPTLHNRVIDDIKRHCVKAQNAIARVDEVLETKLDDYLAELNQS